MAVGMQIGVHPIFQDSIVIGDSHQTQSSVGRTTAHPTLQGTECQFDLTFVERDNAGHLRLSRSLNNSQKRLHFAISCFPTVCQPQHRLNDFARFGLR
jgi:hypothetical protein